MLSRDLFRSFDSSKALHMSIHRFRLRLGSLSYLSLRVELDNPQTILSLSKESASVPKSQVFSRSRNSVRYLSNVSPDSWFLVKNLCLSTVSLFLDHSILQMTELIHRVFCPFPLFQIALFHRLPGPLS